MWGSGTGGYEFVEKDFSDSLLIHNYFIYLQKNIFADRKVLFCGAD